MMNIKYIILSLIAIIAFSCKSDMGNAYKAKPSALARMNEIIVVTDEDLFNGAVKDTFEYFFESAFPIMPSPEPMFDVRHFTVKQLEAEHLRKELRTYIVLANLGDSDSPATQMVRKDLGEERYLKAKNDEGFNTSVGKDKWARGQIVIYLFANSETKLMKAIRDNYPAIAKRIRLQDQDQLDASIYVMKKENPGLMKDLADELGIRMRVPGDYELVKKDEDFFWFKKDTRDAAMNIAIQKIPYTSQDQLTKSSIIALRDAYGKKHVSSEVEGSYMVTNTEDLPTYDYTYDINGKYAREVRGIWEMEKDYKGGPYAAYLVHNEEDNELVFIDAFVFAPGKSKRDMMLQLEYIIRNIEFI